MQKIKEKKTFRSFFQNSTLCSREISKKKRNVFLDEKGDIEKSVFFNYPFDKGRLKSIVCWFFEKHGQYKTLKLLEKLKEVGFGSATNAGISLGIDDLKIPNQKIALLATAETKVAKDLLHYRNAQITGIERVQRLIYTWNQTNDTLKQEVVRLFETTDLLNPIYMMAFSGARGNMSQVRQLVGMRGLMSDPQGQIIDFPIQSNFREGLTLTEYLISTYGARKGIVDTALRTATAGYLTRRLVDVAQHTIVSKFDCGTMRGIFLFDMKDGKKTIYSFQNRLIGRVLAQNIEFFEPPAHPLLRRDKFQADECPGGPQSNYIFASEKNNQKRALSTKSNDGKIQIAFRNQEIDSKLAQAISKVTKKAFVRSPLTCETSRFVCQLCYGWSFSHGKLVSVGEAVGIIAAQSIGEPGTQLTMRTFHTGGVFAGGLTDQILAPFDGKIQYFQSIPGSCIRNALSEIAFFTKMPGSFIVEKISKSSEMREERNFSPFDKQGIKNTKKTIPAPALQTSNQKKNAEILRIPAYAVLFCRNNEFVRKKQVLAQFSSVLKKMQYGRAEQTLYSTLAGEFVFGSSKQLSLFTQQNAVPFFGLPPSQKSASKISKNLHTIGEQSLLLEKRKTGDFSEVELKNDILWKSQNWTTVWILSGNIFCDSFNTNLHFREGDFFKKTSVLKRVLWTKKKRYKYFLFGKSQIQKKKRTNNFSYLFAFEKKKFHNSFFFQVFPSTGPEKSKNVLQQKSHSLQVNEHFSHVHSPKTGLYAPRRWSKHIETNFSFTAQRTVLRTNLNLWKKESFLKAKKIFPFCMSLFSQTEKNYLFSDISLNIGKDIDFIFVQNKSNRFFTDFQKMTIRVHPVVQNSKTDEKMKNHLFFKFLNKKKNVGSALFLNASTFYKTFQISQKFGFFSSFLNFSNPLFLESFFIFQFQNLKNKISLHDPKIKTQVGTSKYGWEKKKNKQKVFNTSYFLNKLFTRKKKSSRVSDIFEKETKNIFLKKYLLRFPLEKIYYKKFGYVLLFSNFVKNKKAKNSFQSFSTLTTRENFENPQRNSGQRKKFFPSHIGFESPVGNENFFGKDAPHSFSYCFFDKFRTNTGGIFQFSFFEHDSKKQKLYYFLCENFSDQEEKTLPFLKAKFLEKKIDTQITEFFPSQNQSTRSQNFSIYSETLFQFSNFLHKKDSSKKFKKVVFSQNENLFVFQIPTFSFLSFSTKLHSKSKPFYFQVNLSQRDKNLSLFQKQQEVFQFIEKKQNQKNEDKNKSFLKSSLSLEKRNAIPLISLSEFGNGNKSSSNDKNASFVVGSTLYLKKFIDKNILADTSKNFKKKNFSPLVLPVIPSFFEKRKQIKLSANNLKIQFFDFSQLPPGQLQSGCLFLSKKGGEQIYQQDAHTSTPAFEPAGTLSSPLLRLCTRSADANDKVQADGWKQITSSGRTPRRGPGGKVDVLHQDFLQANAEKLIDLCPEKGADSTKKVFFFYNFCFQKFDEFSANFSFSENRKQKTSFFDLYEKEIYWLPQENFLVFTSEILVRQDNHLLQHNRVPTSSLHRRSQEHFHFSASPLLRFADGWTDGCRCPGIETDIPALDYVDADAKADRDPGEKANVQAVRNVSNFSPLQFYSRCDQKPFLFFVNGQGKKKSFSRASHELLGINKKFLQENAFEGFVKISNCKSFKSKKFSGLEKEKNILSQKLSFSPIFMRKALKNKKNIVSQFQKRSEKKKNFKKIQKLFSQKLETGKNVLNQFVLLKKHSQNQSFFAKKWKSQCFTCLPVQKNCFSQPLSKPAPAVLAEKWTGQSPGSLLRRRRCSLLHRDKVQAGALDYVEAGESRAFLSCKKLQFKIQQGWLVLPFSSLKNTLFKNHKKILKKGKFSEKTLNFEQNDTLLEMVVLENPSNFLEKFSITTKNISFQADSFQTNKKCRYLSFKPFFQLDPRSCFQGSQKKKMKRRNVIQFFRPFQYKIVENPQNSKKFFQNIRVKVFSKMLSSSCFQIYKGYHSPLLNTQKLEKTFLEKNPNTDFQVWSDFEKMYFSQFVSPFLSFAQHTEKLSFKKNFTKKFKSQDAQEKKFKNFQNYFKKPKISLTTSFFETDSQIQKKGKHFRFPEDTSSLEFDLQSLTPAAIDKSSTSIEHPSKFSEFLPRNTIVGSSFENEFSKFILEKNEKKNFFYFGIKKANKNNFSFYPVQFLPLVISLALNESKIIESSLKSGTNSSRQDAPPPGCPDSLLRRGLACVHPSAMRKSGLDKVLALDYVDAGPKLNADPAFSMNVFNNTVEFQLCEKRAPFFDERFSYRAADRVADENISDFVETSSFWLNKDSMNFLFSSFRESTKAKKMSFSEQKFKITQSVKQKKKKNFLQNLVFQKNMYFYGSTEFLSPYEGELLPIFTHDMYWWKKASEVSTLQKFEKLFTIVTKKDFFSVQFPLPGREKQIPKIKTQISLKEKQKHLGKLYKVLSDIYQTSNFTGNFETFNSQFDSNIQKKTKISSFITKYEKKIYTFQNLTVGYPSLFKKPFLGSFVAYGDNFFGSALQKPGQIIHLGFSSMTIRRGQPCLVSSNGILHFSNIPYIKKNVPLVTLPYQTVQAGDIVQGIPKVEQFFEARTTLQGRLFVSSLPILLKGIFERYKVLLPLEQATRQSFLKIQQIIVDGVQRVYRSQGVSITDKHLEVVVRQMTTKVQILHGAQTGFFPGELVSLDLVERINKFLMVKIRYEPVILGITRASLEVESFLSASSFQQTTKILSLAAISRKKDFLKGLKENLLVGNLIPSGTGYFNFSKKL
jgi:hypothetical protein